MSDSPTTIVDFPYGYVAGVGPACPVGERCSSCGRVGLLMCQTCEDALCGSCWSRHTHAPSPLSVYCTCVFPDPREPVRMHEAWAADRTVRGTRTCSAKVCAGCRKVVRGSQRYLEAG
jgi:hypothetical protein